jgi:hypothetical protein
VFRVSILLVALLALVLAACGGDQPAESPTPTPVATVEPTPQPTPDPTPAATESPDATDDGGSTGGGPLADLLPEEIRGLSRQTIPGMEQMFIGALGQQGVDADEADFAWAMYGDEAELVVTAVRAPGFGQGELEQLARLMSGMQVEGAEDVEYDSVTVAGKSVLRVTAADQTQTVFLYVTSDAFFTIVADDEDHAAELLRQLP